MKRNAVKTLKKDAEIQALIDKGRKAYYRQYRQKPENKAKAQKYQDNFFLKVGLEQLNIKGDKANP
ncbi:hypothetical protein EGH10_04670 [Brevibacillus laterosporus]|uniref:Uncharacterized protein n=1 Tax=Brevibacillus laterosporus LMG 15441 TaxID=1042163 RepID=A0A075RGS3_BRELA|nr:hypothetical protein [Brevibacillus laterosporus]AIG28425.1 hypothetical protein BRLA_c041500 [Brevibacillus laterosporus LMG 15441]RJL13497.1 hypothetical protein DM460_05765 [Brevibacillus laterosporus]TPH16882.1 hypothetical protein EGH10_04670 [Brevibacillus laterosporus]HAS01504.1 hypothetical protein [Brevibacillus sp.]